MSTSPGMAMVNVNNLLNMKDSRWLQLEVCREFQRNKCTRPDTECKFAHPPANVEVQNGRVTACYDSIKGRCNREKPPCKYFHPPQHLKEQLLINGRNNLALKNALMQQMGINAAQPVVPGTVPVAASPYMTGVPAVGVSPYLSHNMLQVGVPAEAAVASTLGVMPQSVLTAQKIPRSDRLEAFPGVGMAYKRSAADKSGLPMYQPATLMQLQQPFVPVSCEYQEDRNHDATTFNSNASVSLVDGDENANCKAAASNGAVVAVSSPVVASVASGADVTAALNPLNYTGFALSKQATMHPPPAPSLHQHHQPSLQPAALAPGGFHQPAYQPSLQAGIPAHMQPFPAAAGLPAQLRALQTYPMVGGDAAAHMAMPPVHLNHVYNQLMVARPPLVYPTAFAAASAVTQPALKKQRKF